MSWLLLPLWTYAALVAQSTLSPAVAPGPTVILFLWIVLAHAVLTQPGAAGIAWAVVIGLLSDSLKPESLLGLDMTLAVGFACAVQAWCRDRDRESVLHHLILVFVACVVLEPLSSICRIAWSGGRLTEFGLVDAPIAAAWTTAVAGGLLPTWWLARQLPARLLATALRS